jgi:hypothetical protein
MLEAFPCLFVRIIGATSTPTLLNFFSKDFGVALAGAFFGALSAFFFQILIQWWRERNDRYSILVQAQAALLAQDVSLFDLKDHKLTPMMKQLRENQPVMVPAIFHTDPCVETEKLTFIVNYNFPEVARILQLLVSAQQCYETSIGGYKQLVLLIQSIGLGEFVSVSPQKYASILRLAEDVAKSIQGSIRINNQAHTQLIKLTKSEFPLRKSLVSVAKLGTQPNSSIV